MSLGGPPSSYATLPDIELTDRDKKAVRKQPLHGYLKIIENWSGWWFGTVIIFFHMLGMSSSQLTNIFFRGVGIPPTSDESIAVLWSIIYWTNCKTSIGRSMAFLCPIEANHGLSVIPGSFIETQSFTIWGNSCIDYSDQQTQVWNPGYNRLILGEISNHNQPYYVWPYYVWLCLGASKNWLWSLFILIGNMMTWFLGTSLRTSFNGISWTIFSHTESQPFFHLPVAVFEYILSLSLLVLLLYFIIIVIIIVIIIIQFSLQ